MNVKGKKFSAGERMEKVLPGVSFVVPEDWDAVQPEGEDIVLRGSKRVTALDWPQLGPNLKSRIGKSD